MGSASIPQSITGREPVSVVVPVYNGRGTIRSCLESLLSQLRPGDEIIVVDDGSTDGTAAVVGEYPVRLITQGNAGPAAARNAGAKVAVNSLLLFTDADCRPEPDWVDQLSAALLDPSVSGARGEYLSEQTEPAARWTQFEYEQRYRKTRAARSVDFIDTYSAAYRKRDFLDLGGFDESFRFDEDQEFSFRMAEAGLRMRHVPEARVWHQHNRTWPEYARRKYLIGVWKAKTLNRHPSRAVNDSHTPQVLKLQVALAGMGAAVIPLSPWWRRSRLAVVAVGLAMVATSVPDAVRLGRSDPALAAKVPAIHAVRALVLSAGLAAGWLSTARARLDH